MVRLFCAEEAEAWGGLRVIRMSSSSSLPGWGKRTGVEGTTVPCAAREHACIAGDTGGAVATCLHVQSSTTMALARASLTTAFSHIGLSNGNAASTRTAVMPALVRSPDWIAT
jgi:hypothetical protein